MLLTWTKTAREACFQLFSVALALAVVLLFAILHFTEIILPSNASKYPLKNAQQVVNLVVAVVGGVIGLLLRHCVSLTNEAETAAELRRNKLTIPRLQTHFDAAGGSKVALIKSAVRNKSLWVLAIFYHIAVTVLGGLNSALGVIFVLEAVTSGTGTDMPVYIPLGADIPAEVDGKSVDPCRGAFAAPDCTYDLALSSLSSQLVTYTPYTIGGVQFNSPNGTLGLPYQALAHFAQNISGSMFKDEFRQYCLPVLDPHIVKCQEEPFNQSLGSTEPSFRVLYTALTLEKDTYPPPYYNKTVLKPIVSDSFQVTMNFQSSSGDTTDIRTNSLGQGTMTIRQSQLAHESDISIITASDSQGQGYASLLHQLMYGNLTSTAIQKPLASEKFVATCRIATLLNNTDHSSWRKVNFNLQDGVLLANVTEDACPNPRYPGYSGFPDLFEALEGAASVLSGTDGYTKLLNANRIQGIGSTTFANMSRLDAAMSKIYHIVQTAYSQTNYALAMANSTVHTYPITMTKYPHLYVIRITWTPTTGIGVAIAVLIALTSILLALRWLLATTRFRRSIRSSDDEETWNLLRPVDVMAYSLAAYMDLIDDLDTIENRRRMMRDDSGARTLNEKPIREGTGSLKGLVRSVSPATTRVASPSSALAKSPVLQSPAATLNEKVRKNMHPDRAQGLGVTVEDTG